MGTPQQPPTTRAGKIWGKQTDFNTAGPVGGPPRWFVTVEENPNTINDGWFCVNPPVDFNTSVTSLSDNWIDIPAGRYHLSASSLSFADGHAENRKWTDMNVKKEAALNSPTACPGVKNADLWWLQTHTTVKQ